MRYHLNEILDIPLLQKLMENFHNFSGMVAAIVDLDGTILLAVGWQDICTKFHRFCPQTECRCRQSDQYLKEHLFEKPYILYKCLNGLMDCAVPIMVDNHHLGTFFTGQFLTEPPDEEFFLHQAQEFGFDESAYIDALRRVPIISEDHVEATMAFYAQLAQILSTMGLQRINELEAAGKIATESEKCLSLVLEGSNSGYWDWNFETDGFYYSPSWYKMLGYSEGEIKPSFQSWKNLIHTEDRPAVRKRISNHLQGNTLQYEAEYRLLTKSGEWKWVEGRGKVVARDKYNHPRRMTGISTDITERKLAEIKLQEERNLNAALLDTAGNLIVVCDQEGAIIRFNQACEQITGYSFNDVKGKFIWDMLAPEDIEHSKSFFDKPVINWDSPGLKQKFENHWLTKDGKRRLISWTLTFLVGEQGSANYVIGAGTDITQQRIIEERLRESESELRIMFENVNGIIYSLSFEGKFTFVSPGWTEHLGHDIAEVEGHSFEAFVHPDDVSQCRSFMERIFTTGNPQKGVEYRVKHLDGSWRWHTSSGAAVKDKAGNPVYYVGLAVDTTNRKQAEKALRESERRFREMLGGVKLVAGSMDTHGNITFCNDFMLELTGWNRNEILGHNWADTFIPADIRDRDRRIINKSLERKIAPAYGESEILTKTGERRKILWSNTLLLNPNGSSAGFAGIGEDITEYRYAEQKTRELLQELEASNRELKDFAYIVSHDLKAPLRGIRSLAEWLYLDYVDKFDEEGQLHLNMLMSRVERMHNLLEGILVYSKVGSKNETRTEVNLNLILIDVIEMLSPPDNISIIIGNDMPTLILEKTRIQQIFENLISNAIKYMDKPFGQVKVTCEKRGDYWLFKIADNGPGIDAKYFDKIFTIFQTLQARDEFESTGIGLTIVKKIVELYNGTVWVESQLGQGTTFCFTLPSSAP